MSSFEFGRTYDEGAHAGDMMLSLLLLLAKKDKSESPPFWSRSDIDKMVSETGRLRRQKLLESLRSSATHNQLEEIFDWITEKTPYGRPLPYVNGFLSRVIKPDGIESVIDIFGVGELRQAQEDRAPMCNIPADSGLIQIASWTGEESDGDAWCLDLRRDCIRCIPVGAGEHDLDKVLLSSYAVFPTFLGWVSYLRCVAYEREWLKTLW